MSSSKISATTEYINVMKQNEHYNQNSAPQLNSVLLSFPYIQRAVLECQAATTTSDLSTSFTIVDYGCSQGANSVVAIEEILSNLRKKYSTTPSFNALVIFNDLSSNDWTTLFKTVEKHFVKNEYIKTLAAGKSFYEQIMPSNSVHFAYTSTSINWISNTPCKITNQCCISTVEVKQEEFQLWKQQAYNDYKLFLQNRSKELKKGGVLLCVGPLYVKRQINLPSYQNLYYSVVDILTSDETLNFNLVAYHRTLDELTDESLLKETNFEVIVADKMDMEQPIYANYKQGKISLDEYGKKYTEFVRSWSEASLKNALDTKRDEQEKVKIIEEVYSEFERRTKSNEGLKLMELNRNHAHYVILRKI